MCMNISTEDIIKINSIFEGNLRSSSSIDFAISLHKNKKLSNYKKLAFILRAVLIDHPFTDGNKRTAAVICLKFAKEEDKKFNEDLLLHHIISIAKKNITNIRNIEWRIKNAIK